MEYDEENQSNYSNETIEIVSDSDTEPLTPDHVQSAPDTGATDSPIKSELKTNESKCSIDEEAECCPVCFEQWTNSGEHRLCSLKCGHLFGQSCIERWLQGQGGKCPQCNAKASKKDIRIIYAKALRVCDTSEKDRALNELEKEKNARKMTEMKFAETKLQLQLALEEVKKLQSQVVRYKYVTPNNNDVFKLSQEANTSAVLSQSQSFMFEKHIGISETGGCRVMAYNGTIDALCVSQPSPNQLFPGFGIKKLSCVDFKTSQFTSVHTKPIRDLSFNKQSHDGLFLTCSLDKFVKVSNFFSNAVVQQYQCNLPIWSCTWNENNTNYFYAGLQNGVVMVYDIRNTNAEVQQINAHGSRSPVLSLQFVARNENTALDDGIIVGQLDRSVLYERQANDEYKVHPIPIEGNITSLNYESSTSHILVTLRPNARYPNVRHSLFKIGDNGDVANRSYKCDFVHTFKGGSTQRHLSKNRLIGFPVNEGNLLACACDEASKSVFMWDVTSGALKQRIPANTDVLDLCSFDRDGTHVFAMLNERQVSVYKWT